MSFFPQTFFGGYWGGGFGPSAAQQVAPADPNAPAKPNEPQDRKYGGNGTLGTPWGMSKAPAARDYGTYRWMAAHPTLAFLHAVVTDMIVAGTRTVKIKDGNNSSARKPTGTVGDGIISSPEDKWAERLDATFKPLWPGMLTAGVRCVQFGHRPGELIWDRDTDATVLKRFKPWLPWDVRIIPDNHGDFAGVQFDNQDRAPQYAMNFVHDGDLDPLYGRARFENCRDEWWEKLQAKKRGAELDQKAVSIVPSIWGPATADGLATSKKLAEALSRGEPTFMTYYEMDIENAPPSNPDAWKREAFKIELHDLGETGPQSLAILEKCRYLDAELAYGYLVPPQAAMEGMQHGAKAVAAVHGQVAVQGMERLHADLIGQVNAGPLRTMNVTNKGPAEAERYYFEPSPMADPQQAFLQDLAKLIFQDPVTGMEAQRHTDLVALLKRVEVPINPKPPPTVPTLPQAPPTDPNADPLARRNGNGRVAA